MLREAAAKGLPPRENPMSETFIQFKEITKTFGGVVALKDVTLDVARGECHGLMGENGAGKSTLGKVLAGIHKPDSGEMHMMASSLTLTPRATRWTPGWRWCTRSWPFAKI
jgi:ABC-type sugar transport system ATPase subunit